jgi:GrpB-like predicted nucleotidyltransferase (UPF0157 family)
MPRIEVRDPDPTWTQAFAEAAATLAGVFGPGVVYIHHIGSTAVPGLKAKPILDLMPVVSDLEVVEAAVPALTALGYEALGEFGLPGRRYFRREQGPLPHHVHCYAVGHPDIARHLAFRDYLRALPTVAEQYGHLKETLAHRFPDDPAAYMDGKDPFIKRVERVALSWWTRVPVVVLSGPVGVGKTTTAEALSDLLTTSGIAHALVDFDRLTDLVPAWPGDPFRFGYGLANLRALWQHARAAGARVLVLALVVESRAVREALGQAVPGGVVSVVRLDAPLRVIERRLHERERGPALEWHTARARELSRTLAASAVEDLVVSADDAPDRIAAAVWDGLGLERLLEPPSPSDG